MKISNTNLFINFAFLVVISNTIFSQEKKPFNGNFIWIKGNEIAIKSNSNIAQDETEILKKTFNFNPIVDFSKDKILKEYKKRIEKQSSLFLVFKCATSDENTLVALERGTYKSTISNRKLDSDGATATYKGESKTGVIVSFIYNKNSLIGKKNGTMSISDFLYNDKLFENQLLELIYIPKSVSTKQKNTIESYLSLKYGISLHEDQNYLNSKGDTIWNVKQDKNYTKRVTGIGKDLFFGLNQKQSKNTTLDGLTIGLNKIKSTNVDNDVVLKDKSFILWGDNGKTAVLKKCDDGTQKRMKRIWKFKSISDSSAKYKVQIKIDKKQMPLDGTLNDDDDMNKFMWLAIDTSNSAEFNYATAEYSKATVNSKDEIVFDNVELNSNSNCLFTIVKANENHVTATAMDSNKVPSYDSNLSGKYKLYPNPISANDKFSLQFNLKETSNVTVQIVDVNGKTIKSKNLGFIDDYLYSDSLSVSGTYLILVTVNGRSETNKLIVK